MPKPLPRPPPPPPPPPSDNSGLYIALGASAAAGESASVPSKRWVNLRAIFTTLNEALARDPGDETIQIMEFFNSDIGTDQESATRTYLLGSDLKVDCSGTGSTLGLNDLIHCIALEKNALPVDVLPAFDAPARASWPMIISTRTTLAISREHAHLAAPSSGRRRGTAGHTTRAPEASQPHCGPTSCAGRCSVFLGHHRSTNGVLTCTPSSPPELC